MFFEGANLNIYEIPLFVIAIAYIIYLHRLHRWLKRDD